MKPICLLLAALASAQDKSSERATYTFDPNGRRVLDGRSSSVRGGSGSGSSESRTDLNGRTAPLSKIEERVVSSGPGGKVVERIVRRFDGSGRPATTEKLLIEESKDASGAVTQRTSAFEADLNGRFVLRERSTVQSAKSGTVERSTATLERPTLNGTVEVAEKTESVVQGPEANRKKETTVYRRAANGRFDEAERQVEQTTVANGVTTSSAAVYSTNSTGKLELATQKLSTVSKRPDGSEVEVVDVYGNSQPGRAAGTGAQLREQQVIERKSAGGQVTETFSIRRCATGHILDTLAWILA
ncbi:MAG: hypothetical protein FJW39_24780 [Acidobacteria bacterium]|nr:hypothetical protein [Acidobacteriota bacterium]